MTLSGISYSPNSFTAFKEAVNIGSYEPAKSNLYEISFALPPCLSAGSPTRWRPEDNNGTNLMMGMILFAKRKLVSTALCQIEINKNPELTKEVEGGQTLLVALTDPL